MQKNANETAKETKNMFLQSAKELKAVTTLAACAMFAALAMILNQVASIDIGPYVRIGFSGIPNRLVDYLFGPVTGCLFSGILDVVKYFLKPSGRSSSDSPLMRCWHLLCMDASTIAKN